MTAPVGEYAFQGPRRGADRAVLLAHGAGADMDAPALTTVSDALADAGVPSLRFQYPYRSAGRRAPDRMPVLLAATREAAAELVRRTRLSSERVVLGGRSMGGRSMGGRAGSLLAADPDDPLPALGLLLLGYRLHPPGRPERSRVEHFGRLRVPVLFVSGTRDAFGTPAELKRAVRRIKGEVAWHWIDTADHGLKPLRSSGRSIAEVLIAVAQHAATWVVDLV